jgi:hypothetical protein
MTFHDPKRQDEASRIRAQLEAIEIERLRLVARLREIEREQKPSPPPSLAATVTNGSPAADKIALFRRLFAGRTDVFPARWENPKSGRSGYAPACANEWMRGLCGKPQVRCGECPNQSFIPVTDEVIEAHLRGEDRVRHNGRGDFVAVSIRCCSTTPAALSPLTLTMRAGRATRSHSWPHVASSEFRQHSSGRAPATAATSGCSLPTPSRPSPHAVSRRCC